MARYARVTTCAWGPGPPTGGEDPVESNLRQAGEVLDRAALDGGDLIVLSELCAHRHLPAQVAHERAEPVPGPITERLGEVARRHGCHLVFGMYERAGEHVHNTAILLGRDGHVIGAYRKLFPTPGELEEGVVPGVEVPAFETDFGRVGMAICWDLHFPREVGWPLAEAGAQLICWPSMYQGGFQLRVWAYLFGAYVVSAWGGQVCEIIDMNATPLAATNYGYPFASADLNFDREVFLRATAREKWEAIRERYGERITLELMHAQGTFSVGSEDAELSVAQIAEEFGLDRRVPYYAQCRALREEALRRAGRG